MEESRWKNRLSKTKIDKRFMAVASKIWAERRAQDRAWGSIDEHPHSIPGWILLLEEELIETKEAWIKGEDSDCVFEELIQIAAVAFACLEQHIKADEHGEWK